MKKKRRRRRRERRRRRRRGRGKRKERQQAKSSEVLTWAIRVAEKGKGRVKYDSRTREI